jgi:hypothetical protein
MPITATDLINGAADLEALALVVNAGADAPDIVTRTGQILPPLAKMLAGSPVARRLTSYGAVADARMVADGAMTNGSATLTSASLAFTDLDVGKIAIVADAGPGGAKLRTTILSRQSATQVTLAAAASATLSGKGVAIGTDCSAAFQAGLDELDTEGGGVLTVDGIFLLAEPVGRTFYSTNTTTHSIIAGTGTDSGFIVAVDNNETGLTVGGASLDLAYLSFVGIPGATDGQRAAFFSGVYLRMDRCAFLGLSTVDQTIRVDRSWLETRYCNFSGSFPLSDLIAPGPNRSVLYLDNWASFRDTGSQFIDYAYWRGMLLSKSGDGSASAWVGIGTPNDTYTASAAGAAGIATFTDTRFDEGSLRGVWAQPTTGRITSLAMIGTRSNISSIGLSSGVYASGVDNVLVDRCAFGLSELTGTAFGRFNDCGRVVIDSVNLYQHVSKIVATKVAALVVRDSVIPTYQLSSDTAFFPESSAAGGMALVKAGAISDADFPAPPAAGTQGFDRTNGRFYVRASGDWVYFDMAGGSVHGPELVVNGTGTSTSGWTAANGGTLSVTGGRLRVTNGSGIYGYATQAVPVQVGKQYIFAATGVTGSRAIRLGTSPSEVTYASSLDSVAPVTFSPISTPVYVTLIVNSEAAGAFAEFDDITLRMV